MAMEKKATMPRQAWTMVADELRSAMMKKGWNISRTARESDVERTFLSRLLNGSPPPRAKMGRQTAEADPRYHRIAKALDLSDSGAFIQAVTEVQDGASTPETLPERQRDFLAHLWGSRLQEVVPSEYKSGVMALLREYLKAANSYGGIRIQRRRIAKAFEPHQLPPNDSPPSMVPRPEGTHTGALDFTGQRNQPEADRNDLSRLLERIGDAIYSVEGSSGIDSQFEIAQLFMDLSRRALDGPEDLEKAVENASKPLSQG
jgi:transcriptional regulator with XRE-family HTH domain